MDCAANGALVSSGRRHSEATLANGCWERRGGHRWYPRSQLSRGSPASTLSAEPHSLLAESVPGRAVRALGHASAHKAFREALLPSTQPGGHRLLLLARSTLLTTRSVAL